MITKALLGLVLVIGFLLYQKVTGGSFDMLNAKGTMIALPVFFGILFFWVSKFITKLIFKVALISLLVIGVFFVFKSGYFF